MALKRLNDRRYIIQIFLLTIVPENDSSYCVNGINDYCLSQYLTERRTERRNPLGMVVIFPPDSNIVTQGYAACPFGM